MKKTIFMLPALALMLFAACSSEDAVTKDNTAQLNETSESAIGFDAYLNRTTTRAGWPGAMTTSTGEHNLRTEGFGVFAYYADGDLYSENAIPDFMYNQKVEYSTITSAWTYEPVKYWPNEFGSSAVSTGVDRVTFFAYAPYVAVDPATGQLTSYYDGTNTSKSTEIGITALTRNGKTGDPYVRYVGAFTPDDCVDLLYGVAAEDFTSKVGAADGANNIKKGDPFINVAKPEIGARLKFDFKHALTKLKVQVDADVDVVGHSGGNAPDEVKSETRVWIRSITFDGIAQRGYLNLNNGMWYEVINGNKISHANVTIHDGLRDGAEALATDEYEAPTGINPQLRQSVGYTTTLDNGTTFPYKTVITTGVTGVTSTYQNLFSGSGSLLVIPANEQLKVTIVYDVETADATLPNYLSDGVTKGSTVENRITKAITLGGTALKLDAGKEYTLNLHLGMTSVKFDAQVSDWTESVIADDTWLPINGPTHAAVENPTSTPVDVALSAEAQTYQFAISGLDANEAVTTTPAPLPAPLSNATTNAANASGLAVESIDITENTTVSNRVNTVTWKGATKGVSLKFTQAAAPLGLGIEAFDADAKTIQLKKKATGDWAGITDATSTYDTDKNRIQVKKNGAALTGKTGTGDPAEAGKFTFDTSNGKITLNEAPKAGDVFTITVKAGDAEAETITVRVGGPVLSNAAQTIEYGETYTRLPDFIGPTTTTPTYSWDTSDNSIATVANGVVTTVAVGGPVTISVEQTAPTVPADGWVYDNNTKEYDVTVTKAAGTISFTNAGPLEPAPFATFTENAEIINNNPAVLKNSKGTTLTTGSIGDVTYAKSGEDAAKFKINSTTGVLSFAAGWTAGESHEVTVTATVDDSSATDAGYAVKSTSYTITVKAAPEP